jgi:hypothetical protein
MLVDGELDRLPGVTQASDQVEALDWASESLPVNLFDNIARHKTHPQEQPGVDAGKDSVAGKLPVLENGHRMYILHQGHGLAGNQAR